MISSKTRRNKVFTKKLRTQSKGEVVTGKGSSANSSKSSNKALSNLSKSNSRRKERKGSSKHMKKKSAAIPTRSTKALYLNKSEYERKRNSKAIIGGIQPSSSAANINWRYSGRYTTSQIDSTLKSKNNSKTPGLKYPHAETSHDSKSNSKEKYTILKSSQDKGRFIEFKLHDEDLSDSNKLESDQDSSKEFKTKFFKPKLSEPTKGVLKRLYGTKSDPKMETLKSKYGKLKISSSFKPKHPSMSIVKPLNSSKSSNKYEFINKPSWKVSRNPALKSYKEVRSNKNNLRSENQLKKIQSALSIKTASYKPSQVNIYLKKDD